MEKPVMGGVQERFFLDHIPEAVIFRYILIRRENYFFLVPGISLEVIKDRIQVCITG